MKKTSRRNFGKQLTGALAAASVSSLAIKEVVAVNEEQRPKAKSEQRFIRTHDTPPPLEFDNGSFVVEKQGNFDRNVTNGDREEYKVMTGSTVLAHIKIVDGSGEMLFRKDEAGNCKISVELRNNAGTSSSSTQINSFTRAVSSTVNHFIVDLDLGKALDLGIQGNNDKPTSKKRNHRFRHSTAQSLSMWKITITEGSETLFTLFPRTLPSDGEDLKVMMWLE